MIVISSYRPARTDPKYDKLQRMARRSWEKAGLEIFAEESESPPTINWLSRIALARDPWSWVCLINSDIVVSENLSRVGKSLWDIHGTAASSRRFEFNPDLPLPQKTSSVDLGLDCFIALPGIWHNVAQHCPDHFILGRPQWDTWLHGFLNHHYREHYYDFSKWGCIFHRKHERKSWTGPVLDMPWEAKDLEPPQELPMP